MESVLWIFASINDLRDRTDRYGLPGCETWSGGSETPLVWGTAV